MSGYYDPSKGPWCFGEKSRRENVGVSPSRLLFTDPRKFYAQLDWILDRGMEPDKNEMAAYFYWVKERAELLEPIVECRFCRPWRPGRNFQLNLLEEPPAEVSFPVEPTPISCLSVIGSRNGISMGVDYSCCDREDCKQQLLALASTSHSPWLLPATFKGLAKSEIHDGDYKQAVRVLQQVHGISGRVTNKRAHKILSPPDLGGQE